MFLGLMFVYPIPIEVNIDNNLVRDNRYVKPFTEAATVWGNIVTGVQEIQNHGLTIEAKLKPIDGYGNTLAQAGPTQLQSTRKGFQIPVKGEMFFDAADIDRMIAEQTYTGVVLHEMGHVLGIGSLWKRLRLVMDFDGDARHPYFVGATAMREYGNLLGRYPTPVPVEDTGEEGTFGVHWRESVFDTELMTAYSNCSECPISRLTLGSLEDIGYTVDYRRAGAYPFKLQYPPIPHRNTEPNNDLSLFSSTDNIYTRTLPSQNRYFMNQGWNSAFGH